ncbi:MAG: carbohydrate-binding family 9-like protein [Christensenellaceae bacterium]|jgi:hypothetical protein|nr:carbohydrate-binding family 9-like protein [Christensenellaceae bacterium]
MLNIGKRAVSVELVDNLTGGKPLQKTVVELFSDDETIKVTFECSENYYSSVGRDYNDTLWMGDIVEIMITLGSLNRYLEIEVNPDGVLYAVLIDNIDLRGNILIKKIDKAPFSANTLKTDTVWTAHIAIPLKSLKALDWNLRDSKINIYRQDFRPNGELVLYAYSPTFCEKFHIPSSFVSLNLK